MACELCTNKHPNELWRNKDVYVIDANEPLLPGYIRVVLCRHIAEMSDLSRESRHRLSDIVNLVEQTMRQVMQPDKINLAAFGTMVPHLHWHVIARFKDDPFFPSSTWSAQQRKTPEDVLAQRRLIARRLNDELVKKLNEEFGP